MDGGPFGDCRPNEVSSEFDLVRANEGSGCGTVRLAFIIDLGRSDIEYPAVGVSA